MGGTGMNYQNIKIFQAILEHQNISAAANP